MSEESGFFVDVLFDDRKVDHLMPGMIHSVTYGEVDAVIDQIEEDQGENFDWVLDGLWDVKYFISGITFQEGQMSFPETAQWDFPPYVEFETKEISRVQIDEAIT